MTNSEMIQYHTSVGNNIDAYLARPEATGRLPAVVLIHEIFGLNDHIKKVADRIAKEGYVVLAPHLYSFSPEITSIFTDSNLAVTMKFMGTIPRERMRDMAFVQGELAKVPVPEMETIQKVMGMMFGGLPTEKLTKAAVDGIEFLKSKDYVNGDKVGTIGFCFGGNISINMACSTRTSACVLFYGSNPNPIEQVEKIQCPVMGLYGAEDTRLNADLDKLTAAMAKYKKDFEMKIYPGAAHAFFNNTNKHTYNRAAAKDSWKRVKELFKRTLKE